MVNHSQKANSLFSMYHEMKSQPWQHVIESVTGFLLYIVANAFYIYASRSQNQCVSYSCLCGSIKISTFSNVLWSIFPKWLLVWPVWIMKWRKWWAVFLPHCHLCIYGKSFPKADNWVSMNYEIKMPSPPWLHVTELPFASSCT